MSDLAFPKNERLEIPGWTEMAHNEPCMLQIPDVCEGRKETSVWAHSNMSRHGRGSNRKSDDCFGSIACYVCHFWLDYGPATRAEKEEALIRGFERSIRHLIVVGKLTVNRKVKS